MDKKLEVLVSEASDIIEKMSEYVKDGTFWLRNGSFTVEFDNKLQEDTGEFH